MSISRIASLIFCSLVFWVIFWPTHRDKKGKGDYIIQVPSWLNWLCGRPRPDNKLELSAMIMQIGCLISIVLWLPMRLLRIDESLQVTLAGSVLLIAFSVGAIVQIVGVVMARFKGEGGDSPNK